ncbi:hypothetical protein GCM10011504_04230 [Siccirubricoccus deserti]|uniref:Uncharacterized protein n=1 Tax=Siccirubricoccus deserti TaxID=2013562 RepID=A0A9X0UEQ8_9PROT|nr:hypothetical protein [Siccirubricoccus deserti]MBC4013750.1 hypothetical protein [Siccirubricoccus deserti]GGC29182.1 hypothetical protein GCM10011504_04230 [Siccirubricoccus deserti]
MPDIILAQYDGSAWLVAGVDHLDALLENSLPPEVSFEIVACREPSEVDALWRYHAGAQAEHSQPWAIHPNIVRRMQGLGTGTAVAFTAWSALLNAEAQRSLGRAAEAAKAQPDAALRLIGQVDPAAGPMPAAMLQMRLQMVEDALAAAGIDRARLRRVIRNPETAGYREELADVIDIHIGEG